MKPQEKQNNLPKKGRKMRATVIVYVVFFALSACDFLAGVICKLAGANKVSPYLVWTSFLLFGIGMLFAFIDLNKNKQISEAEKKRTRRTVFGSCTLFIFVCICLVVIWFAALLFLWILLLSNMRGFG